MCFSYSSWSTISVNAWQQQGKVENIFKEDSLDLIPSRSPSLIIQIFGRKVYLSYYVACFICFSQKFSVQRGTEISVLTKASLQKFLCTFVQKISVKSRWNQLITKAKHCWVVSTNFWKLFVFKSLLTTPSNVLPFHLKWIFTEGDGIESRLPFKTFSTLSNVPICHQVCIYQVIK